MKKYLIIMLLVTFSMSLLFAGGTVEEASAEEAPYVAFSGMKVTGSPCNIENWNAFIEECEKLGVEYTMFDAGKSDIELQIQQVEQAIALDPDVLIVNFIDESSLIPQVKKAHNAGIPVIGTFVMLDEEAWPYSSAYIVGSGVAQGATGAEIMAKGLKEKFGEDLTGRKAVIIQGDLKNPFTHDRTNGFVDRLAELAPGVEVLDMQTSEWDKAKAILVMEGFLAKYPQIDGVFGNNDGSALGGLEAAEAAGRLDEMVIVGVDGVEEALLQIKAGKMYGTVLQSCPAVARMSVNIALKIYNGEEVELTNIIPNDQIYRQNVDQYMNQ